MRLRLRTTVNVNIGTDDFRSILSEISASRMEALLDVCGERSLENAAYVALEEAAVLGARVSASDWAQACLLLDPANGFHLDVDTTPDDHFDLILREVYPSIFGEETSLQQAQRMAKAFPPRGPLPWSQPA